MASKIPRCYTHNGPLPQYAAILLTCVNVINTERNHHKKQFIENTRLKIGPSDVTILKSTKKIQNRSADTELAGYKR